MEAVAGAGAYPWGAKNVDTDVIIPAHWLKTITREGLGKGAFETVRARARQHLRRSRICRRADPDRGRQFRLRIEPRTCRLGAARHGLNAVIAPSFSDIFSGNAFKNGILTVVLPQEAVDRLMEVAKTDPINIDLETQTVTTPFQDRFTFEIDPFRKHCLLNGLDEVGMTLAQDAAIAAFEAKMALERPWL